MKNSHGLLKALVLLSLPLVFGVWAYAQSAHNSQPGVAVSLSPSPLGIDFGFATGHRDMARAGGNPINPNPSAESAVTGTCSIYGAVEGRGLSWRGGRREFLRAELCAASFDRGIDRAARQWI